MADRDDLKSLPRQVFDERHPLKLFIPTPCLIDVSTHGALVTRIEEQFILLLSRSHLITRRRMPRHIRLWQWQLRLRVNVQIIYLARATPQPDPAKRECCENGHRRRIRRVTHPSRHSLAISAFGPSVRNAFPRGIS